MATEKLDIWEIRLRIEDGHSIVEVKANGIWIEVLCIDHEVGGFDTIIDRGILRLLHEHERRHAR
jgi:hypothetical protein